MNISKAKQTIFNFKLYDVLEKPVSKLDINIQYYNTIEKQWLTVYSAVLNNGVLLLEQNTTSRAKAIIPFLSIIKSSKIPELRLVPKNPLYKFPKQEVLSILKDYSFDEKTSFLTFNFDTVFLLEKQTAEKQDTLKEYILISSKISPLNVSKNIVVNPALEKSITDTKTTLKTGDKVVVDSKLKKDVPPNTVALLETKVLETDIQKATLIKSIETKDFAIEKLNKDMQDLGAILKSKENESLSQIEEINLLKKSNTDFSVNAN